MGAHSGPSYEIKRAQFRKIWKEEAGSPSAVARRLNVSERSVYGMRERMGDGGDVLETDPEARGGNRYGWKANPIRRWPRRREITVKDRCILVGSDAHFWPGIITTAWRAFCVLGRKLDPAYVILNGDTVDGATVSRHDPIAWEERPTLQAELEAVADRLEEIQKAAPNAKKLKTAGNHDTRFDRKLASNVPEFRGIKGMSVQDHFPGWPMSWSIMVNGDNEPLMITHAISGGVHAVYNNTLKAGISVCTGHLHKQLVRPFTDYRGTRYGIDSGTLADIDGEQFEYTRDGPVDWRSGFAVLTFDKKGRLQPPELCEVQTHKRDQAAFFRGKIIAEGKLDY